MTKYADVIIRFTVEFEDDGENALKDQAFEAALQHIEDGDSFDLEVIGEVRDTDLPSQEKTDG